MPAFQIVDDIMDIAKKAVKMGSGNDIVGSEAFKATAQGLRDSIQAQEVVRSFNKLGATATADITLGTGDAARKISKGSRLKANTMDEARTLMGQVKPNDNITAEQIAHINKGLNSSFTNDADLAGYLGRKKSGVGYFNMAKGYFGDETYGAIRRKTAIGAGAAASVGIRYLSGGNLTTNAQGERDIAGIPFI